MIQRVLDSVITIYLWHVKLMRYGEGIDGGGEQRVSSVNENVKIAGHLSLEGVHHNLHLFLYCLYLCDNMWWSRIREGWEAHILSLRSVWGIATFWSLSVSSLGTSTFLVFFLGAVSRIPLA